MELAVLDYDRPERHAYAYRLAADRPWVDLGARRSVTFTNLEPGRYSIAARARNGQGVWSEASSAVEVEVVPPFWRTGWFRGLGAAALLGLGLLVHAGRTRALERRNRGLEELRERLSLLTRRLEAAKEDERRRIARELHDDLGPSLTAVILNLQTGGDARKAEALRITDDLVQRVRDLSLRLRPPLLDEVGLALALRRYLEVEGERAGIAFELTGRVPRFDPEVEIAAFRIAQEAVTNVIRHAQARHARVELQHDAGQLHITVEDDGRGFVPPQRLAPGAGEALGLLGMEERARGLGGRFSIDSGGGAPGTRVRVSLPAEALQ
jgi:signal transduction histidine kinase